MNPDPSLHVTPYPKAIDLDGSLPYANYNWELVYHIPVAVAVHLSQNGRFAEAQKWFHYIFDPTSTDTVGPAAGPVLEMPVLPEQPGRREHHRPDHLDEHAR